jgi:RNA polymerase sigma factor (sigma-70 family)
MDGLGGDRSDWIERAVSRFEGKLLLYAGQIVGSAEGARDVVQEVFVKLCAQDRARVDGHLAEWLYRVCRNAAMDVKRKERRMRLVEADTEPVSEGRGPVEEAEAGDSMGWVLKALEKLGEDQREAIRLKFQHGMSYREIARITGHSETNVGFLIHAGIKKLRERVGTRANIKS